MNDDLGTLASRFSRIALTSECARALVRVGDLVIGGGDLVVMAGPCSVESESQLMETAEAVAKAGARVLRGGAYKPRSSPYAFQGLGLAGLKLLSKAREEFGLKVVTEVMSEDDVEIVAEYADIMQVGSRNMENYSLLEALGRCQRPVLLKRGLCAKIEDLLTSAQLLVESGNPNVMLCERGIRTFETATRNTLDVAAIAVLKAVTRLPVISDPSHGVGIRSLVPALACASIPAGADGLIVEVHPHPEKALSDGEQSLYPEQFAKMMNDVRAYAAVRAQLQQATSCAVGAN